MTLSDISWGLFLCGLGLFMYGVVLMGDGLKSLAGNRLKDFIDKYTSKPWQGILIGTLITALVQSSSATTAITIGFIRAGLMSLTQAAGVILGANIGSTVTSFLIGLNISGIAPYLIVVGAFLLMFSKNKKMKDVADIMLGFGVLFYGISLISTTLEPLKDVKEFADMANLCAKNPFLGIIVGIVMTFVMQSSAAAIGVVQIIYQTGAMPFAAVLPFIFGSNIGTCITALLTAMGGNVSSKRGAFFHLLFNIIGAVICMIFLAPLNSFGQMLAQLGITPMMQIAIIHFGTKFILVLAALPFIKQLCNIVKLIIRGEEPKHKEVDLSNLDPKLFPVASAALVVAYNSLLQERDLVLENTVNVQKYLLDTKNNGDLLDEMKSNEDLIDKIDASLTAFLTDIKIDTMSDENNKLQLIYLEINKNLERIGDMAINIMEMATEIHEDKGSFTEAAHNELNKMFETLYKMLDVTFKYVDSKSMDDYGELVIREEEMDSLEEIARLSHFDRITNHECKSAVASSLYVDILYNLERMADHCCNIAKNVFIRQ